MKSILFLLIFTPLLLIGCQSNKHSNVLSTERIYGEVSGGETDTFYIKLEKNRFVFASLFQMGIDLCIKVINPENVVLREIDSLKSGPEFIAFTSFIPGEYKILVFPFNPMAVSGRYSIALEKNIPTNNSKEDLVYQLFADVDNDFRAGAAVAIIDSEKVIYKNGFGISDFDKKTKITSSTRLCICSIGKQITALAIALLEEKGLLSFDDDIRKYLPELHDFGNKISIIDLLNHSSGLRELADMLELCGKRCNGPFSRDDATRLIYRQKELNFKPGSDYLYCNTGYVLLAVIIEQITHQQFTEWVTDNIFKPLGMNDSFFYHDPDNFIKDFAWSYSLGNQGNYQKEPLFTQWYIGAGNIFTSVEDMSKWIINYDYPKVGSKKLFERMEQYKISMNKEKTEFYSFGRVIGNYRGLKYFWHGGGAYGYTAQIIHFPDYKFGSIVLSNFIYGGVYGSSRKVAEIYLRNHFTGKDPIFYEYKTPYKPIKIDQNILYDVQGTYINDSGYVTTLTNEPAGLFIQTSGFGKTELYAQSDSVFFIKESDVRIYFIRDSSKKIIAMRSKINDEESLWKKQDLPPENTTDLTQFLGKYYCKELDTYYTINISGNSLTARHEINGEIKLTCIKDRLFRGDKWYFSLLEFVPANKNEAAAFKITNDRVRNIMFAKVE